MTTKPKPATESVVVAGTDEERTGAVRLRLEALDINHRTVDFPARFAAFCEQNDQYEMVTLDGGDVLIGFSFPVRQYVFDLQ